MLQYLWVNRERPAIFSRRWIKVWLKRIYHTYGLARIYVRRLPHSIKGVKIGELSLVYGLEVNGRNTRLAIGEHTFIGRGVHIATHAEVRIGSYVCINNDVRLLSATHDLLDQNWRMFSKAIEIGDYAWIATGATILPGVTIGRGAVVGAGAVVSKDVPDFAVATGNPSRLRLNGRVRDLKYDPVIFTAPFEAWIGGGSLHRPPDTVREDAF